MKRRDASGRVRRASRGSVVGKTRVINAWIGYTDGEPYCYINDYGQREWCVFVNRADGRKAMADLRKVILIIKEQS